MLFAKSRHQYKQDPWIHIAKLLNVSIEQAKRSTKDQSSFAGRLCNATLQQQVYHLEDFNCTVLYPKYTFNSESCHHFVLNLESQPSKNACPAFQKTYCRPGHNFWRNCRPLRWDALGNCLASHTESKHYAVRDRFRQAMRPYNDILTRWRNPS